MRRIGEIALFSDDVAAAVTFYARLVGSDPTAQWPGGAIFDAGGLRILVHDRTSGMVGDGPPNEDHVAFSCPELDVACASLAGEGLTLLVEPRTYDWGRSAYLRDPDGRLVELSEA